MIGRGGERREESARGDARTSLRSDCNEECTLKHSAWVITWNKGEKPDRREAKSWEVRESHFHQRQLKEPQEVPPCGAPCLTREPSGSGEITVGHGQ